MYDFLYLILDIADYLAYAAIVISIYLIIDEVK